MPRDWQPWEFNGRTYYLIPSARRLTEPITGDELDAGAAALP